MSSHKVGYKPKDLPPLPAFHSESSVFNDYGIPTLTPQEVSEERVIGQTEPSNVIMMSGAFFAGNVSPPSIRAQVSIRDIIIRINELVDKVNTMDARLSQVYEKLDEVESCLDLLMKERNTEQKEGE